MPEVPATVVRDSARLLVLSTMQRALSFLNGSLYLFILPPASYAAWRSIAAFLQIGLPGWALLQSDFAQRRSRGDQSWVAAWKGVLMVGFGIGLALFAFTWLAFQIVISIYSSARGFEPVLMAGSLLFITNPLRTCLSLWWQVVGRFDRYTQFTALESACYSVGLLLGFFLFRIGVLAIPIALIGSQLVHMVVASFFWSRSASKEAVSRRLRMGQLVEVWHLLRGEGKWAVSREMLWDWFEALRAAVLNMIFPATTLGHLFAAETLVSYATAPLAALQPLFQVRLAETKQRHIDLARRASPLLVTAAWMLFVLSLPVLWLAVHFVFKQYVPAFPFYAWYALQLPWSAMSLVLTPFMYAYHEQKRFLAYTVEKSAIELGMISFGFFLGPLPAIVISAHLVSGYLVTLRRLRLINTLSGAGFRSVLSFLPDWASFRELWRLFFSELSHVYSRLQRRP